MKMSRIVGFGLALTILAAFLWLPQFAGQSDAAEIQMRTYYFVLLKRGPSWTSERSPEVIQVRSCPSQISVRVDVVGFRACPV